MTIREFLDSFARLTSYGWLSCEEALLLVAWAERTVGPIIEVGSYMGRSAMLFAQLPDRRYEGGLILREVYCCDPWADGFHNEIKGDEVLARFKSNIHGLPNKGANIHIIRSRVEDWAMPRAEFIYLDGDHTYQGTINQIEKALEVRPEVIAIHDVNDEGGGRSVKQAALDVLGKWTERLGRVAVWDRS